MACPAPSTGGDMGSQPEDVFGDALGWGTESGLLDSGRERLRLTEKGVLLSNELFERLL